MSELRRVGGQLTDAADGLPRDEATAAPSSMAERWAGAVHGVCLASGLDVGSDFRSELGSSPEAGGIATPATLLDDKRGGVP